MPDAFQYDVFLSRSANDKPVVRPLAEHLRKVGMRNDSQPSTINSQPLGGSDWAQLEAGTFRFRDPLNQDRRFIPLRLDDAPSKGSLAQFLFINWLPANRERGYPKLLEACRPLAQQKAAEPEPVRPRAWRTTNRVELDRMDEDLLKAISIAVTIAMEQGKEEVSTRLLFAVPRQVNPEGLAEIFRRLPSEALPAPIGRHVEPDEHALGVRVGFSPCVQESLELLSERATSERKLSTLDVFVDIAKHGHGNSVAQLRTCGVDARKIDEIVSQLGWRVIQRSEAETTDPRQNQ